MDEGAPAPPPAGSKYEKVQCFGRKKTAVAVALVRTGSGQVRLNGCPLHTVKPDILRVKVYEPLLLLGKDRCKKVDIRLRVKGGGFTGQIYALRQAIAKGIIAYYQKYIDEASKKEIKDILMAYDRSLIVADPRRCEPKKFGGAPAPPPAGSKYEKVQCFGRKKTAVAVALVRTGSGQVRLNGCPLHTVKPDILRVKVYEPLLLLGKDRCKKVDIRLRVKGGGFTGQIYALRQDILMAYDRSLIVADPRRCEPKKFGGAPAPPPAGSKYEKVQCFGRKKTAVAVALVRTGSGQVRLNGCPLHTVKPDILRVKVYEPLLLLGKDRCKKVDIRLRVKGGGFTGQIYALRQAIAKGIIAYYQKYIDEASKKEIKDILMAYDRSLIVADPRRCEPKKFGGRSARARFQKSYR
ncbi:unnamed protein product [Cladocopium goreaui]|uniref:40S ribosomal protein S16 n=1 Tax=Cladocopium goreaui TaxID=2562237 RepID=A0A9P1G8X7_9DINO|nr:unnamed protein product [Cladocopium goreaui]